MTQYVTTADALFFHKVLIERYGGATGIRDAGALESALHRPQTGYYDTIVQEAAALLESLVQNHPFVDGNKRTSLLALYTFLGVNGVDFVVPEADAAAMILSLAAGEVSEESLTRWIRDNWPPEPSK